MKETFQHIIFEETYLLGWQKSESEIELYLEVILSEQHPDFDPAYKTKGDHACYNLARLGISGLDDVQGLLNENQALMWNEELSEYDDVDEIVSVTFKNDTTLLIEMLSVPNIEIKANGFNLKLEKKSASKY